MQKYLGILLLIMCAGLVANEFYLSGILLCYAGLLLLPKMAENTGILVLVQFKKLIIADLVVWAFVVFLYQNEHNLKEKENNRIRIEDISKKDESNSNQLTTDSIKTSKKLSSDYEFDLRNTWIYTDSNNKMGEETKYAIIWADNLVYLDFPYDGGSQGIFQVRKSSSSLDLIFSIDKGQIDFDYSGTNIRVKFDDEKPTIWIVSESSTNDTDVLFFSAKKLFLNKLKKSKNLVLEIPFYQNGNQQFEFNIENLVWD
jgi:hypothetical protein